MAGAISKITGGSFAEGFFKGLIVGSLTTILALWIGPSLAGAVANGIAQLLVTEWYINEFANTEQSCIRIGMATLLGFLFGWASRLPSIESWQADWFSLLKTYDLKGFKAISDQMISEGAKFMIWRSITSAVSAVVNWLAKFVFSVEEWVESINQQKMRRIHDLILNTFSPVIPELAYTSNEHYYEG